MNLVPSEPVMAWPEQGSAFIVGIKSKNLELGEAFVQVNHGMKGIVSIRDEFGPDQWECVWVLWEDGKLLLHESKDLKSRLPR